MQFVNLIFKQTAGFFILLYGVTILTACSDSPDLTVVRTDSRPNIVFIYTDDQGYADIGANQVVNDIVTPNIDNLAATGVRMTDGYATAPQCVPSRAALMSGRYQQTFGLDDNKYTPFPLEQPMLAEKLATAGYSTGMVGKWHLRIDNNSKIWYDEVYAPGSTEPFAISNIPVEEKIKYYPNNRGFQDVFFGYTDDYHTNFNLKGDSFNRIRKVNDPRFRVDVTTDAAVTFIDNHKEDPFFLYVAYYAPHVPLEATAEYLARFPGDMPERRRYALAMLSAVDDGVGRIMQTLENHGLDEDTIVFFMSDNGAPLSLTKVDADINSNESKWDGSLNDPWIGEKGMLTEGAIRVPFIVRWKNHLPEGLVYSEPVITIDASVTAATLAGVDTSGMDGINLIPYLNYYTIMKPDRALFWRFWQQSAIRKGNWKYLRTADEAEYLFDLSSDLHETKNLLNEHPDVVLDLYQELGLWANTLKRPGIPGGVLESREKIKYDFFLSNTY